ncbi:MAG: NAD(P)-dependent alcohol dehydrogenase [candidate division Zixibacteria bacterium]|nr:NAD(P)-dependent alcohol dehydrogenase [candidate division Zixibacteria bacterium]
MKAIVYTAYGPPDVLQFKEIEKPVPKDSEVLIKVLATTVTRYDCWARSCKAHTGLGLLMRLWFGLRKPKNPILGTELSGKIEAVGRNVKRFKIGDPVFGYAGMNLGAYAEYICLSEGSVALKPTNVTYVEAAAVLQGSLTALFFLRKATIKRGQKILILGASGGVGMYSVQLAKYHFGAEVTGVCSTAKLEFVKSLGADNIIDYAKEDFTKRNETCDIIFDTFAQSSFSGGKVLKKGGAYLFATYGPRQLLHMLWLKLATRIKVISPLLNETTEDLILIKELIESRIIKPIIDKCFPLKQTADAHEYFESGQKKGNIVIKLAQNIND